MKGLWIFLGGVATGALGSILYVRKFLIPEIRKEIEKEQSMEVPPTEEYRCDISDDRPEALNEAIAEVNRQIKDKVNEIRQENREGKQYLDYTKFSAPAEKASQSVSESKEEKAEEAAPEEYAEPYIIDEESFDEHSNYRSITFEIYSDGVILDDETEEELDADPELVFGKTAMDALKESPQGIVCVRDDSKKCDYRLERKDFPADGPVDVLPPGPEIDWGD